MSKLVGHIRPPPEIRAIVDKTAQFVAKNGPEFEAKIMADKGGDMKFAFLKPENPYHAYYRFKVQEAPGAAGGAPAAVPASGAAAAANPPPSTEGAGASPDTSSSSSSEPAAAEAQATTSAAALPSGTASGGDALSAKRAPLFVNPLSRALKAVDLSAPAPRNEYTVPPPAYTTPETFDVIKLTAQYTAVNGRSFLSALAVKESRNLQFDFLRPSHALFPVFTELVDAYAKILRPSVAALERLAREAAGDRSGMLERGVARLEHWRANEEKKREAAAANESERAAQATIDWHDFVIGERGKCRRGCRRCWLWPRLHGGCS